MQSVANRILVALDVPTLAKAKNLADQLRPLDLGYKVGSQLCTAAGAPDVVREIGDRVFLDLKFHDIPNTVAGSVTAACELGVWMLNVHCSGGPKMMQAAMNAALEHEAKTGKRPLIIGVTVLTSLDGPTMEAMGIFKDMPPGEIAARLAVAAKVSGLDGVVCSPLEVREIRRRVGDEFHIVTPGIRKGGPEGDQLRTDSVTGAVQAGSTHLVIGRPITDQPDPVIAATEYIHEFEEAFLQTTRK